MKKFLKLFSIVALICCCMFSFVGCNIFEKDKKDDNTILFLDGSSVVMSLEEAESLLSQAKAGTSGASLLSTDLTPAQYTKSDLLLIINQIKENMINSTTLSLDVEYDNHQGWSERAIVRNDLEYGYTIDDEGIYESWIVKESDNQDGEFTEYTIETKGEQTTYTKRQVYDDEEINIEVFCQDKFSFMLSDFDFNENHIEGGYVHNNNLYIKLHIDEVSEGTADVNESFIVKGGRIVSDKLSWLEVEDGIEEIVGVAQTYAWDDDIDATLLERANNIPQNVAWQED